MCPGALRPWAADDGLLVRLRLVGGRLPTSALRRLAEVSASFADGDIHLTARANLQVRGFADSGGQLSDAALAALESTGLLPSRSHELVRNILVSPQTGLAGGRADLRAVAAELDALLLADPDLSRLPGRFLFTLDDGRGDLLFRLTGTGRRGSDLGLVALGGHVAQLRIGDHWGDIVEIDHAATDLTSFAKEFLAKRGTDADAAWHVRELAGPLREPLPPDPRLPDAAPPLPYGDVPGGTHEPVPDGILTPAAAAALLERSGDEVVVTPWHGILIPPAQRTNDQR